MTRAEFIKSVENETANGMCCAFTVNGIASEFWIIPQNAGNGNACYSVAEIVGDEKLRSADFATVNDALRQFTVDGVPVADVAERITRINLCPVD